MEWFSTEWWSALLAIIVIDLVLAGDNAVVIGMAARNLSKEQQKRAIVWGTVGAIVIRTAATMAVVWLLKIPGLLVAGGMFLVWIAIKLLIEPKSHDGVAAGKTLAAAIRTIIVADTVMGLDNVIAVAGAAHEHFALVVVGLLVSVPIMVWGSSFVLKAMERFPWTIYVGAGVLALTAGKMIVDEPLLKAVFAGNGLLKWGTIALSVIGVLVAGRWIAGARQRRQAKAGKEAA